MKMKLIAVLAATAFLGACTTDPYTGQQKVSNTAGGAALGAGVGALAGLAVGGSKVAQRNAVLIGAGIGALAGGAIGATMDRNEAELRAQLQGTGVSVTRAGNQIILNMPSDITFGIDQDNIKPDFYSVLNSVALVLKKYNQTVVDVFGHTDSTGSAQHNFDLSQRRALSVANYLSAQGVDSRRFAVTGFGKTRPIATNDTPEGRAENRRVEIQLSPLT
ncbi:outer membrane protein OmpA-like peptidoglycan-associated protein [Pseudaminobacter salicylatoxidans]|uniref:Outer membrane protein OmpA-like peptidoglycan-associated protein n=1 Tax=Pseudaminobacter salicylatoxidans TaxID=93369 RepID=A0A316C8K4_PSESE|nr:OmpA family protein [Pseudaminobacter salicylatoxidans]PWJ85563.1 outer membrane protein OmpA-like peptidoglycan-associated protein [Pseudaminobacter salicylatoxidans]